MSLMGKVSMQVLSGKETGKTLLGTQVGWENCNRLQGTAWFLTNKESWICRSSQYFTILSQSYHDPNRLRNMILITIYNDDKMIR